MAEAESKIGNGKTSEAADKLLKSKVQEASGSCIWCEEGYPYFQGHGYVFKHIVPDPLTGNTAVECQDQ